MVAILPPIDFPPMMSFSDAPSSRTTARQVSRRTFCGSGRRFRAAIYGNSNRTTRMPAAPMLRAIVCMNGETIGPPAPCANTYVFGASCGPSMRNLVIGRTTIPDHAQPHDDRPTLFHQYDRGSHASGAAANRAGNGAASDGHVPRLAL